MESSGFMHANHNHFNMDSSLSRKLRPITSCHKPSNRRYSECHHGRNERCPVKLENHGNSKEKNRGHNLWEKLKDNPCLNISKGNSHCHHGALTRIHSTDNESEVKSSYPASPAKSSLLKCLSLLKADQKRNDLTATSGDYECHKIINEKLDGNKIGKVTPRNVDKLDNENSKATFKNSKDWLLRSPTPKRTCSVKVKNKMINCQDSSNDQKSRSNSHSENNDNEASGQQHGSKPKVRKIKEIGMAIIAGHKFSKGMNSKPMDSNSGKHNDTEYTSRLISHSHNANSITRKSTVNDGEKKSHLWSKVKINKLANDRCKIVHHTNNDDDDRTSSATLSKSKQVKSDQHWNAVRKRVINKTDTKNNNSEEKGRTCFSPEKHSKDRSSSKCGYHKEHFTYQKRETLDGSNKCDLDNSFAEGNLTLKCNGSNNSVDSNNDGGLGLNENLQDKIQNRHNNETITILQESKCNDMSDRSPADEENHITSLQESSISLSDDHHFVFSTYDDDDKHIIDSSSDCDYSKFPLSNSNKETDAYNSDCKKNFIALSDYKECSKDKNSVNKREIYKSGYSATLMSEDSKEECYDSESPDDVGENTSDEIDMLTLGMRSSEYFRKKFIMNSRMKRCNSGSVSDLSSYRESFCSNQDEDSAVGSMNSLIRSKTSLDMGNIGGSLKSLDNWEYSKPNLNSIYCTGSIRSLDSFQIYSKWKHPRKGNFCSLTDVRECTNGGRCNLNSDILSIKGLPPVFNCQSTNKNIIKRSERFLHNIPKISQEQESIRHCIMDKISKWQLKLDSTTTTENDLAKMRTSHGWDTIRQKILEKKCEKVTAVDYFRLGGGEGESEWISVKEDVDKLKTKVENAHAISQRTCSVVRARAPKFADCLGKRNGHLSTSSESEVRFIEKKIKTKSKFKHRRHRDSKAVDIVKDKQKPQVALMGRFQDMKSDNDTVESFLKGFESGIGSSFEDNQGNSNVKSGEEELPQQEENNYNAIENCLLTVDHDESNDDADSSNRESVDFDPEELMFLTNNDESLTREDDLIECYDISTAQENEPELVKGTEPCDNSTGLYDCSNADNSVKQAELNHTLGQYEFDFRVSNSVPDGSVDIEPLLQQNNASQDVNKGNKSPKDVGCGTEQKVETVCMLDDADIPDNQSTGVLTKLQTSVNVQVNEAEKEESIIDIPVNSEPDYNKIALPDKEKVEVGVQKCEALTEIPRGHSPAKEDKTPSQSLERSLSCSENIRAFLLSQASAKAPNSQSTEWHVESNCEDKHVYLLRSFSEQSEEAQVCSSWSATMKKCKAKEEKEAGQ